MIPTLILIALLLPAALGCVVAEIVDAKEHTQ